MIYEPREDSYLLQKYVLKFAKGKVLDMGTGSGVLAETALKKTKDVLAADIDEKAVDHIKSKGIKVIKSDLFSNINGKFDLIIFNPPYLPNDKQVKDIALDGGKKGYELLEKFLIQAKNYLNKDGKILIAFSSLTKKNKVDKILKENGYSFECLETQKLFFEELYVYLVERKV